MKNMARIMAAVVLGTMASLSWGDQLVVTGQTKEGTFQGYEKGKFEFANAKGRLFKEQAGRVMKMVLPKPLKVNYTTSDGKLQENASLKGYEKRNFVFDDKGKQTLVPQIKMKSVEVAMDYSEEGSGDQPGRYPVPQFDVASFAGEDLSDEQQKALDAFTEAKKTYDDFVLENSELVKKMDALTGAKREEVMNELRKRKNDEQPLRKALVAAYKDLTNAFPEPAEGAEPAVPAGKAEADASAAEEAI